MAKQTETKDITIKEASKELDISESTVKKYLKDFELPVNGSGNKATISQETFQAIQEISKLKANGLTIQEIKELKSQEPSKTILDELEETAITKKEEEKPEEEKIPDEIEEEVETELKEELEVEAALEETDEESTEEAAEGGTTPKTIRPESNGEQAPRRRGFNYRYVERQVSMDSKKVSSLRQRLRNPNLSVQDRLFFEESLERRILFLNGWKHILRWIAK